MLDADSRHPVRAQPTSRLAGEPEPAAEAGADGSRAPATGRGIAERLAAALTDREPGWRLPRRSALAKRYAVGIDEIDAAIADLVRGSLIRRLPDGQLYRASPADRWIAVEGTAGLGTRLDPMGNMISCLTRQVSRGEAPRDVADALGLSPRARLWIVRCVWSAGDDPVAVSAAYLPGPAAGQADQGDQGDAADADEPNDVDAGFLADTGFLADGPRPAVAVSVEMSPPQPETARTLRVPAGQPVITVTVRFGDAADDEPAAVTVVTLKPELFRVAIDLKQAHSTSPLASGCERGATAWRPHPVQLPGCSDRHVDLRHLAVVRGDGALAAEPAGGEHAERPRAGRGEEPEAAVLTQRDLGHELVTGAEQPRVAGGHRGAVVGDPALHDRLIARRRRDGDTASRRAAAVIGAHRASPSSIGTPTSEPYSVHEPS